MYQRRSPTSFGVTFLCAPGAAASRWAPGVATTRGASVTERPSGAGHATVAMANLGNVHKGLTGHQGALAQNDGRSRSCAPHEPLMYQQLVNPGSYFESVQGRNRQMVAMDSGREAGAVRVLLMASGVNSLTQRVLVDLKDAGYDVTVRAVADQAQMQAAFERAEPDLVVAPYLKRAIPESLWSARPCLVVHPGIRGDRGPSSLDWAIHGGEDRWGVTVLQANAEFDAGDIWAHRDFAMRPASKSALYRHEVADAASAAVQNALWHFRQGTFTPAPLDYGCPEVRGRARPAMKQSDRTVDWSAPTNEIMRKLRCSDSSPGVSDVLAGAQYYLFGAHEDDFLNGAPGTILAQRDGAVCRATGDGAIWIERLKAAEPGGLKLPAADALRGHLCHVPTLNISPGQAVEGRTFREIRYHEHHQIGYLHFEFYNGAMSTSPMPPPAARLPLGPPQADQGHRVDGRSTTCGPTAST